MLLLDMDFSTLVSNGVTVFTTIFGAIQSNWLLMGVVGVSVVIPMIFGVVSYIKSKVG